VTSKFVLLDHVRGRIFDTLSATGTVLHPPRDFSVDCCLRMLFEDRRFGVTRRALEL
jgi:hypothetical protein